MTSIQSLLIADGDDFVSRPVETLELTFHGIPGDRHAGATRPADSRTPWHKRGMPIANTRHVSIVSVEECATVAELLGIGSLDPALLGANIVLAGLEGVSQLPPSTRLQFPSGATVFVTEANAPCRHPGLRMANAYGDPSLEFAFPKHAQGLRGVVGIVEREGIIGVGNAVRVILPRYQAEGRATAKASRLTA